MGSAMLNYLESLLTQVLLIGGVNPCLSCGFFFTKSPVLGLCTRCLQKEHCKFSNIKKSGSIITSLNSHLRVHSFSSQTLSKSFTNVLVSLLCKMKIVQYIFYQHTWVTSAKKKSHIVELFVLEGMLKGHLVQLQHNERGQDNEQLDKVSQRLVSPHC